MSTGTVSLYPIHDNKWNHTGSGSGQFDRWSNDSILIYLTVGGSMIPIRVLESDSIATVKIRIQKYKGFLAKGQKLVFHGKELARNNSRVRDYGMMEGDVLHLVLRLADIQAITVRTVCGKEFKLNVPRKRNVRYVKQQISKKGEGKVDLKDQELFCDSEELEDQRIIDDICRNSDAVIHLLVCKSAKIRAVAVEKNYEVSIVASVVEEKVSDLGEECGSRAEANNRPIVGLKSLRKKIILEPLTINPKVILSPIIKKLLDSTFDGLERGGVPVSSTEGSGGVYFMPDSFGQDYVSVFKPIDEEPMAVNNPRGLPLSSDGEGLKKGTRVGEGAIREVAAYILDHPKGGPRLIHSDEKGFAGVPPTVMVKCLHPGFYCPAEGSNCTSAKFGSLQMFVKNQGSCEDIGPRDFPVEEVHKICVLDIRLANADRHAGNILLHKDGGGGGQVVLIPIDHGYCMPENFEDCTFEWLYWPQARQPFSRDTIAYINSLDAEKDIKLLEFYGWKVPWNCARVFLIATMLLKKGAERGLTPFAIGSIMCRETLKEESAIEKMFREAQEAVLPETNESAFLESISKIMNRHLDRISPSTTSPT